jgi:hypothetical protein
MAEQELAWLASHKEQIAALGEDPNLVKALERELARSAARSKPAAPPFDASQLRLGDDFAARVLPSDKASVWLDTAPPPRAAPPPPRAPPSQTDPRTWTKAVDPASGYAYRYDANGNSVWEHELAPAPPVAAQPIPPPSTGKASKRAARYSESSASGSSSSESSDSSDDDCCECFRSRPAYKKLSTT